MKQLNLLRPLLGGALLLFFAMPIMAQPGDRGPRDGRKDAPPLRKGERRPDGPPPRLSREDAEKVRPFMEALNPFYPPTGYATFRSLPADFAKDVAARYGERRELLETLSKRAR